MEKVTIQQQSRFLTSPLFKPNYAEKGQILIIFIAKNSC